jgi:hypothetical protein
MARKIGGLKPERSGEVSQTPTVAITAVVTTAVPVRAGRTPPIAGCIVTLVPNGTVETRENRKVKCFY